MWLKFIILLVGITLPIVYGQVAGPNPCETANGGCSHTCIHRGANERQCGCPCDFTLAADQETCEAEDVCDLEILVLIDDSSSSAFVDCSFSQIPGLTPPNDFVSFRTWRDQVISIMKDFEGYDASIGIQFYDDVVRDALTYQSTNLTGFLDTYRVQEMPATCASKKNYGFHLTFDVDSDPFNRTNFQYLGPGPRADLTTTTRIAIVFTYGIGTSPLVSFMEDIDGVRSMNGMDAIIVVNGGNSEAYGPSEPFNRYAVCGDATAVNCPGLFYFDKVNDDGLAATMANLVPQFALNSCASRRTPPSPTVSCDTRFAAVIPTCLLEGLTPADLVFADESCAVTDYTEVGSNFEVPIQSFICGIEEAVTAIGFDLIQRLSLADPAIAVGVEFNETFACTYVSSPFVVPEPPTSVNQTICRVADQTTTVQMQYTTHEDLCYFLPDNSTLEVGCRAFFVISFDFVSVFSSDVIKIDTCTASSSLPVDSAVDVLPLIVDGCPIDTSTVQLVSSSDNEIVFFTKMFEFVSTLNKPNDSKDPVYVTCSYVYCSTGSTLPLCNVSCPARKKRSAIDSNIVSRKVLPFGISN